MVVVLGARVVRPLEPFAEGFAGELARQGYTVQTSRQQLGLVAHLSRWMSEQRIGVAELTPLVVERYVRERRDGGYRSFRSAKALGPLVSYLCGLGGCLPRRRHLRRPRVRFCCNASGRTCWSNVVWARAVPVAIWTWSPDSSSSPFETVPTCVG